MRGRSPRRRDSNVPARDVLVIDYAGFKGESFLLDSASRITSEAVRLGWRNLVGYGFNGGPRYVGTNLPGMDGAAARGVVIELYGREFGDFIGALLEGAEIWVYGQGQSHLGLKADSGNLFVLQDTLNTCMYAAHGGTINLWDSGSRFAVAGQNKVYLGDGRTQAPGFKSIHFGSPNEYGDSRMTERSRMELTTPRGWLNKASASMGSTTPSSWPTARSSPLEAAPSRFSAWVKAPPVSDFANIVAKSGTAFPFPSYALRIASDGRVEFLATDCGTASCGFSLPGGSGSRQPVRSSSIVADDTFHFVAGVREADGTLRIYVDGVLENARIEPSRDCDNSAPLAMGASSTGTDRLLAGVVLFRASSREPRGSRGARSRPMLPRRRHGGPASTSPAIPTHAGILTTGGSPGSRPRACEPQDGAALVTRVGSPARFRAL